jgi:hypothetical protein
MQKNAKQPTSVRPFFLSAEVNYDRFRSSCRVNATARGRRVRAVRLGVREMIGALWRKAE